MVSEPENKSRLAFPWERQAMNGDEMPDGLGYPEQILYLSLRLLYKSLRLGAIERPTAIVEKKKLMDEYRCYKFREQMGEEWVEVTKNTELARAAYRKNPTHENAMLLIEIIEGRKLGAKLELS
ncbi:MAG: hypothetical protein J6B95_08330 [Oscillospiraceae bacterium]|nr:hypothetical protein [Oscillospiraceae bacterium]